MNAKPVKHYTASAFIISTDQPPKALLVHHRKYGKWMMPGGHQEAWENPLEAVIREVEEETGLDVSSYLEKPQPIDDHVVQLPLPGRIVEAKVAAYGAEPEHYHIDQTYVIKIPQQPVTHAAAEAHDIGWFTAEELDSLPMFDNVRTLLKEELAK